MTAATGFTGTALMRWLDRVVTTIRTGRSSDFLACAVTGLLCAFSAQTQARPLLFVFENYPPYEYQQNGDVSGINVDIIRAVCKRLNVEPTFQAVPWVRALKMVRNGDADAIFSLFNTEERTRFLYFPSEPLSLETNVLVASPNKTPTIRALADLKGKTVGVVAGNSYGAEFDASQWITKQPATGSELLLRKQAAGRTDVSISNELVAKFLITRLGLENDVVVLDFVVSSAPLYVAFPKTGGDAAKLLAQQFSTVLGQLRQEGILADIEKAHLAKHDNLKNIH